MKDLFDLIKKKLRLEYMFDEHDRIDLKIHLPI